TIVTDIYQCAYYMLLTLKLLKEIRFLRPGVPYPTSILIHLPRPIRWYIYLNNTLFQISDVIIYYRLVPAVHLHLCHLNTRFSSNLFDLKLHYQNQTVLTSTTSFLWFTNILFMHILPIFSDWLVWEDFFFLPIIDISSILSISFNWGYMNQEIAWVDLDNAALGEHINSLELIAVAQYFFHSVLSLYINEIIFTVTQVGYYKAK
ncbi:hypothetical protein ACJX0J_037111, partial [Zea mays]